METEPLRALLLQIALLGSAALLARRAKPLAVVLGAAAFFGAPWLAGSIPIVRGVSALLGFIGLFRVIDLVRTRESWSTSRRMFHVLSFVDSRTLRRAPPRVDVLALGRTLLWSALAAAGFYVITHCAEHVVRLAGGLVLAYAAIESL